MEFCAKGSITFLSLLSGSLTILYAVNPDQMPARKSAFPQTCPKEVFGSVDVLYFGRIDRT